MTENKFSTEYQKFVINSQNIIIKRQREEIAQLNVRLERSEQLVEFSRMADASQHFNEDSAVEKLKKVQDEKNDFLTGKVSQLNTELLRNRELLNRSGELTLVLLDENNNLGHKLHAANKQLEQSSRENIQKAVLGFTAVQQVKHLTMVNNDLKQRIFAYKWHLTLLQIKVGRLEKKVKEKKELTVSRGFLFRLISTTKEQSSAEKESVRFFFFRFSITKINNLQLRKSQSGFSFSGLLQYKYANLGGERVSFLCIFQEATPSYKGPFTIYHPSGWPSTPSPTSRRKASYWAPCP